MSSKLDTINKQEILDELEAITDQTGLEAFHARYLWKKWLIPWLYKSMKDVPNDQKKSFAQSIQVLSEAINTAFQTKQDTLKKQVWDEKLNNDLVDITMPGINLPQWHLTLLAQERRKVEEIFQWLGYAVEWGNHVVTIEENFESVNIPATHPATEMHDTLYLNETDEQSRNLLLRTHTSAHQVELIKKHGTPCKFVVPWRVYRNEKMDTSHDCVFWQVEGVMITKDCSLTHLKNEMQTIVESILESTSREIRIRPAYFPFVEPGIEIDARYALKNKEDRLEILWAWMIHPNVLRNAWLDPKEWNGFAFWIWLTRLIAIKYGIDDIRLLTNADMRFIESF